MSVCRQVLKNLNKRLCINVVCFLIPIALLPLAISPHKESKCAYVMILMACYWLLEPVPISATALLPVVLFPLLGVVSSTEICQNYMKESFMMFIGGLIMAIAVEECKLHERIALKVLLMVGTEIKWLMFGFMVTTMVLSMWISNTATTAMMVPIVDAIVQKICIDSPEDDIAMDERRSEESLTESKMVENPEDERKSISSENLYELGKSKNSTLKTALLLSICYSANIGGTGTLTGTAPNLILKGLMEELHPDSDDITFASWMIYNIPGMILCVLIAWFYLWLVYIRCSDANKNLQSKESIRDIISKKYEKLGSISAHEAEVMVLFFGLVLLWIFRDPKFLNGWAIALSSKTGIGDSVPAIAVAVLLFFVPSDLRDLESRPILEWKTAQLKLPWGLILLTGGGFALANAAQKSGLSYLLGVELASLGSLSPVAIVAISCIMTAMLTEITSNSTTATILLPVFSQMAISIDMNPLFLMLPIAVVCSYAFMLPVATPANAIAFESGRMETMDMAKPGIVMNIVCCGVQLFMINTLGVAMFDLNTIPSWVNSNSTSNDNLDTLFLNSTFPDVTMVNVSHTTQAM